MYVCVSAIHCVYYIWLFILINNLILTINVSYSVYIVYTNMH